MPSRIGQQNARGDAAAKVVVVYHDMRVTRNLGLEIIQKGRNKIHVLRRTTWTDRRGEVEVRVEVEVGVGEGKAKGQARRGVQQGEIDHR
jgi:hypothetical protein